MSSTNIKEAERVMTICNACRYCEGFCAVFPAMELRRIFTDPDLNYLANLCHNCRGCYYACQYAPPHEFAINVPKALGAVRMDTYRESVFPRVFSRVFKNNGKAAYIATALSILLVLAAALIGQGAGALFDRHTGENAFYHVLPYGWIVTVMSMVATGVAAVLFIGCSRYLSDSGMTWRSFSSKRVNLRAVKDTLRLRYLDGGGHGCNYPDDRFGMSRRWLHHLVFYGFFAAFGATSLAAIYDHVFHLPAPYPFTSLPVLLGTLGGMAMLAGTGGLLYLKGKMDRRPIEPGFISMDVAFLWILLLTNLTGFLVLVFRETPAMGILLVLHVGFVLGFFIMMPYGKFVHGIYRFAALVRNAAEIQKQEKQTAGSMRRKSSDLNWAKKVARTFCRCYKKTPSGL